jgi:hypothetical protein
MTHYPMAAVLLVQTIVVAMDYAHLVFVYVILDIMVPIVQSANQSIMSTADIFAPSIKEHVDLHTASVITSIITALVKLDILVHTVPYRFVPPTVVILELVLLLGCVVVLEEKLELIAQSIVDVEVMVHVLPPIPVPVILDLSTIQHQRSANTIAWDSYHQIAMGLIY